MTLTGLPSEGFGKGLNLRDKPDTTDAAECIDALNTVFTERGAVEQRPGYDNLTAALTNRAASLEPFYQTSGTKQLLAGCGTRLEALSTAGAVVASATGLTSAVWDFARFGQPNAEVAYAGNGTDTLRKWDGAEWTTPPATVDGVGAKAMPKAGSICIQPTDNRLVCSGFSTTTGGPNGGISSPSHVYWSEAGNPESFESTAFVQFTPGDGERIQAVIAWKEFTFVFKETKFFVITGTSTNAAGKPEFNYRPVDAGTGLVSSRAICVHPTGIYFMSRQGVYRTTGQEPELISSLVSPIWSGEASSFYTGGVLAQGSITNCAMGAWESRIYLAFPTAEANSRVLVYDPRFEWWSLYDIPASCISTFRISSAEELVFGYASGENKVGRHSTSFTNDDGTAIKSRWRSGWDDHGIPDSKTMRGGKLWGTGAVSVGIDSDFSINTGGLETIDMSGSTGSTFGGAGTFGGEGLFADTTSALVGVESRIACNERGTTLSVYFANATLDQKWSIHRLDLLMRESRKPSTITT